MDYYERKKSANYDIDRMLEKGTKKAIIIFRISTDYGFSDKFIEKRIKIIKEFAEEQKSSTGNKGYF